MGIRGLSAASHGSARSNNSPATGQAWRRVWQGGYPEAQLKSDRRISLMDLLLLAIDSGSAFWLHSRTTQSAVDGV
jgi:hypothetical protein